MTIQENVQKWIDIDNKIKEQNELIKRLRNERNSIEENITTYASNNNLNNLSIKTNEGVLKLFDLKTSSPLSFKYIEKCLSEIIDDDEKVLEIITYLKEKRSVSITKSIKKIE
tara:strand:- start:15424 stop:15762 length:339 start_codon:yes stop_codon:yes gene_type:complete